MAISPIGAFHDSFFNDRCSVGLVRGFSGNFTGVCRQWRLARLGQRMDLQARRHQPACGGLHRLGGCRSGRRRQHLDRLASARSQRHLDKLGVEVGRLRQGDRFHPAVGGVGLRWFNDNACWRNDLQLRTHRHSHPYLSWRAVQWLRGLSSSRYRDVDRNRGHSFDRRNLHLRWNGSPCFDGRRYLAIKQNRTSSTIAMLVLAAIVSAFAASWSCNEATHRWLRMEMRETFHDREEPFWKLVATSSAPFEVIAPWTSKHNHRLDHPPPVVRGGWLSSRRLLFAAKLVVSLLAIHVALTLAVSWLYQRKGRPKRIAPGVNAIFGIWRAVVAKSAWAGLLWPSVATFLWVGWYWFLLAPMPESYAQAHIEPLGVLGLFFGSLLGHAFTVAYFVRTEVRRQATTPPNECLRCGYSLAGISTSTCPECGREVEPNDKRVFGLSRLTFRWSVSWMRWVVRGLQIAVVLYFVAFPRTLLLSASFFGDHSFQRFVYSTGDPCSYWVMRHLGLGGDGSGNEDVIDPDSAK